MFCFRPLVGLFCATWLLSAADASPRRVNRPAAPAEAPTVVDPLAGLPVLSDDERELLDTALEKAAAENDHWAYTQVERDDDDAGETIARYDPSQPEDAQWTLLQLDGRVPGDREKTRWEKKRVERAGQRRTLGELIDLAGARLSEATADKIVVEVPLRTDGDERFPPEKFRVRLTLDRAREALTAVDVDLRGAFRVIGVVKVVSGALEVGYAEVDPAYPPQPVRIAGGGVGRVLFVKVDGSFEVTRRDFARVEPYSNRYDVEVGEVRALDF